MAKLYFTDMCKTLESKYPGLDVTMHRDIPTGTRTIRATYETSKPEFFVDEVYDYPLEITPGEIESLFISIESKVTDAIANNKEKK